MEEQNVISAIGKHIEFDDGKPTLDGWKSLTNILSIYSDKRYETARYLFLKDGVIDRHIAVSSHSPAATIIKPDDDFIYNLRTYAEKTDSQIVFLHNHPSGYVVPSDVDISLTTYLENHFKDSKGINRFSGHIILDHGNYGLYQPSTGWKALIDGNLHDIKKINDVYQIEESQYGIRVRGDLDLILLSEKAKELDAGNVWNREQWVPAWLTTNSGVVRSLEYINTAEFEMPDVLSEKLRFIGRENGSNSVYLIPATQMQRLMCEGFAQQTGMVRDVYYEHEDGGYELSQFEGGSLFNGVRESDITVEDSALYDRSIIEEKIAAERIHDSKKENKTMEMETIETDVPDVPVESVETEKKETINVEPVKKFNNIVVFDTETTGLDPFKDELLQFAAKNGNGEVLINTYVCPTTHETWPIAQSINHISPDLVKDAPAMAQIKDKIQDIINSADLLISYNGEFDLNFLRQAGVEVDPKIPHLDVMRAYAPVHAEIAQNTQRSTDGFKWQKLVTAAEKFDIPIDAHDALGDVSATLSVAQKLYGERFELLNDADLKKYSPLIRPLNASKQEQNIDTHTPDDPEPTPPNMAADSIDEGLEEDPENKTQEVEKDPSAVGQNSEDIAAQLKLLQEQMKTVLEKMTQLTKENNELRRENAEYRDRIRKSEEREAHERGYDDDERSEKGKEREDSGRSSPRDFSSATAFNVNVKVPDFGLYNQETGTIEKVKGCRFARFIEDEDNISNNKVVLIQQQKDGSNKEIVLSEEFYRNIVNNYELLEQRKSEVAQDSFQWLKAHEDYNKNLNLDRDMFRCNTSDNFRHNFELRCRMYAHNPEEAMQQAKELVENMSKYDKKKFNDMRRSYGKDNGEAFDKDLIDTFFSSAKEQDTSRMMLEIDENGRDRALIDKNRKDLEVPLGTKIGKTNTCVGDSIKMAFKVKDFEGHVRKTPKADFEIIRVSKGFHPDKAILYSSQTKSSYTVPLPELEKHIRKYEKSQLKEHKANMKKDHKLYGYEGASR